MGTPGDVVYRENGVTHVVYTDDNGNEVDEALDDRFALYYINGSPDDYEPYTLGEDGQIHPERDVSKRFGIQAIPTLRANGEKCAHVKAGECVRFTVDVEVPADAGTVTEILFSRQEKVQVPADAGTIAQVTMGQEIWDQALPFEMGAKGAVHTAHAEAVASYDQPGTYFATVRIASNRKGETDPFTQVLNLDRARIIVS